MKTERHNVRGVVGEGALPAVLPDGTSGFFVKQTEGSTLSIDQANRLVLDTHVEIPRRSRAIPVVLSLAAGVSSVIVPMVAGPSVFSAALDILDGDRPKIQPSVVMDRSSTSPSPKASPVKSASPVPSSTPKTDTSNLSLREFRTPEIVKDGLVYSDGVYYDFLGVTPEKVMDLQRCGNETDKVLLTFDDSGSPEQIQKIADTLKDKGVGAAFYLNTKPTTEGSEGVSQATIDSLREQGFFVGNHTADHSLLTQLSEDEIAAKIKEGGQATYFRPTGGATYFKKNDENGKDIFFSSKVFDVATRLGKSTCLWSVDTNDWRKDSATGKYTSVEQIRKSVSEQVTKGATVLFHVNDPYNTLKALPEVIDDIRSNGYELCPISDAPTSREFPETLPCD